MSEHIHHNHNVSILLYHLVCPAKYRRAVFSAEVDTVLRDVRLEIAARYDIGFLEIGTDRDHVHFLVQTIPPYSPTKLVRIIKSLTAREIFRRVPTVKQYLWGGEFWSDGCPISTVGPHGSEGEIHRYIVQQVLALVAEGKTNKEIAGALELSDKTVKNYLSHVFEKLNVSRRAEGAAFFARQRIKSS